MQTVSSPIAIEGHSSGATTAPATRRNPRIAASKIARSNVTAPASSPRGLHHERIASPSSNASVDRPSVSRSTRQRPRGAASAPPVAGSNIRFEIFRSPWQCRCGTSGSAGSAGTTAPDPGTSRAVDLGSAKQGSSADAAGGGSGSAAPVATEGSAGSGSGYAPTVPDKAMVTLTLVTKPPGVRIFVDNEEQPVRTPEPFKVPRGKAVRIVLKSAGYEDLALPALEATEDRTTEHTMKPKRRGATPPPPDPNSKKGSGTKGSGGGDDSGLMKPG